MKKNNKKYNQEIYPDEIFLDSSNLPQFNVHQLEGRLEKPIPRKTFLFLGLFFVVICTIFLWRLVSLQAFGGDYFRKLAENNRLHQTLIATERGVIFDREMRELAWNELFPDAEREFPKRKYIDKNGFAHILGFIQYPAKDKFGFFYQKETEGKDGIERFYNEILRGENGLKIVETNVFYEKQSESVIKEPVPGNNVVLSIDALVQEKFFEFLKRTAERVGFSGGAGVIIDVHSGEILSLVSYPEYDNEALSLGENDTQIKLYIEGENKPFLNRVISGLYIPGSIVKPFLAIGALTEGIIDPLKVILSEGFISIPNPYFPGEESVFNDWKAHGWVDMRRAIAISSNVYFFEIGGGYKDQKGLGIKNIEKFMNLFGFGENTGIDLYGEEVGLVPTPQWKAKTFGEPWRIGDTYNTSIGQYGFQVTPIQAVRAVAAIANGGIILTPHLVHRTFGKEPDPSVKENDIINLTMLPQTKQIVLSPEHLEIVRQGMRQAVTEGIAQGLYLPSISVAAKTGTAELGAKKQFVNSWVTGFFPYENPRFAFAIVMERGPRENLVGALYVARSLFEWMSLETPDYLK